MLKAINKGAKAAQSAKLKKMGAMGSLDAAKKGEHAPRKYATGGTVDLPVGGGMAKPNLSKPGRSKPGSKGKGKKAGTNVNVIVMPKPDAAPQGGPAPDMPMPKAPPMPAPPPAPPMAGPPMPPPGAGGPAGPGPMPMRKSGGKVLAFKTGGKVPANIRNGEKNTAMAKAHAMEKGNGVGKPMKRADGGKTMKHDDKAADEALIRKMVKPAAMKAKSVK